jgi:hypothetical protein
MDRRSAEGLSAFRLARLAELAMRRAEPLQADADAHRLEARIQAGHDARMAELRRRIAELRDALAALPPTPPPPEPEDART